MHPDPLDRPPDGLDAESARWWRELHGAPPSGPVRLSRREQRRLERAVRRRQGSRGLGSKAMVVLLAVLLASVGALSFVERGPGQTWDASFNEGGHLDGTTVEGQSGDYAFLSTQPGTQYPVTYGPCRSIKVEINTSGEVSGGSSLVLEAMARVSELSGITLVYAGPSTSRPDDWTQSMTSGGMEAYPPALVSWSDEDETPDLDGDVVGVGGSISLRGGDYAQQRYITGSVTLDAPDLAEVLERSDGRAQVRAVILHEFGHLLGLGHVQDPRELMSESNQGQLDFGPGDKEGLARLGAGDC